MAPTAGGPRSSGASSLLGCPMVGLAEPTRLAGRTPCHSVMHDMPKAVRCQCVYSCLGWHIPSNPDGRNDRRLDCIITLSAQAERRIFAFLQPSELGVTRVQIRELGADTSPNVGYCLLLVPGREQAEWFESCQPVAISTSGAVASPHSPSRQPGDRFWLLTRPQQSATNWLGAAVSRRSAWARSPNLGAISAERFLAPVS